jgi:hypothetical protein
MEEMSKHGGIGLAAMKADLDRTAARKDVKAAKLPSAMTTERYRPRQGSGHATTSPSPSCGISG